MSYKLFVSIHTVGPATKEVPESAIAAQPPEQNPNKHIYHVELGATIIISNKNIKLETEQ